ncbi:phosphoethanolamine--lipid A transferase EptA [Marinicellulosiphila megalodicopiae]|uniref:phosphoethanolamine--lipid A transferase EptA n=1 Tax=Marinicellulosiphila megalodicopiae TaxID=2724896 RepID=UPI003BAE5B49
MFVFKESNPKGLFANWKVGPYQFILLVSFINVLVFHKPLFDFTSTNLNIWSFNGLQTSITLILVPFIFSAVFLYFAMMIHRHVAKTLFILLIITNSVFLYYIETYNIILDKSMMGNIFNTDREEVANLITYKVFVYLFCYGCIPSFLLFNLKCKPVKRIKLTIQIIGTFFGVLLWIFLTYKTTLWIDKNGKRLGGLVLPWSYVVNGLTVQIPKYLTPPELILLPEATIKATDKTVVVLVFGETARAKNFEFYGYERDTNPKLKEVGAIALKNAKACTTYTTGSLKCMMSHVKPSSKNYEPLPNYMVRNSVEVWWRSNNWGEKNIEVNDYKKAKELRENCKSDGCFTDEVLMRGVIEGIQNSSKDQILVILHQSGSHGPTYYKKYPKFFEKYTPVCKSVELNTCSEQSLINAYDNTIYYTDFVLTSVIEQLKQLNDYSTVMIYASDHGESLGESGLYLHGTPKQFAPDVQIDIPFIVWMSDTFKASHQITEAQLLEKESHTHQNIFHSVMGAFKMQSDIYQPEYDIFNQKQ